MTAESMPLVRGTTPPPQGAVIVGRYALYSELASGGMAAVHFGTLLGAAGLARVLDFGIAKAGGRVQVTRDGQVKGKLSYFAPEQLSSDQPIDRRADIYAASATLWETMTGRRLVQGDSDWQRVTQICAGEL